MEDTQEKLYDAVLKATVESGIEAIFVEVKFDPVQRAQVRKFIEELRRFSEFSRSRRNYLVARLPYRDSYDTYRKSRDVALSN